MINKTSTIKNFWIIFFAAVAVIAVLSTIYVGFAASEKISQMRMSTISDENTYKISQENNYKQALYAACDSMKNLDANLGKAAISANAGNQAQMLTYAIIHANQVNQNLAKLPIAESDNLEACQKFVNQAQDYATYLLKKIGNGETLSATERAALGNLDNVATQLYNFLEGYAESDSGMFLTNGNGANNGGALSDGLDEVDEDAFAYEKLIYDGPFSDSVEEKTLKRDSSKKPDEVSAELEKIFGKNTFVQAINNKGTWYAFETENGRILTAADGNVAQYEMYKNDNEILSNTQYTGENCAFPTNAEVEKNPLTCDECIARAEEFCKKIGYDVKCVWISKTQDFTTYINCATVIDNVIVYPDLIKVAVDSFDGEIVGVEAKAYLFNHGEWDVTFGKITSEEAQKQIDRALTVTNVAKALVEKNGEHYRCFEFQCQMGDRQYYVYIDSETGNEVEIFKVIKNTEGFTVM